MLNTWLQEPATLFSPQGEGFTVDLYRRQEGFPFDDHWGIGARQAWAQLKTRGLTVAYLGVGAGAEVVQGVLNGRNPAVIFLNDIVPENLEVCVANLEMCDTLDRTEVLQSSGRAEEVLTTASEKFDLILGCLPQVPFDGAPNDEQIAHVYPLNDYQELSEWGFGLLYAVLEAARTSLNRRGRVSLVVSGRIPWEATLDLFRETGFQTPKAVHRFLVRHHAGTPLEYLFGQSDHILFGDRRGKMAISPEEAEEARLAFLLGRSDTLKVFHWVHIIEANPR